MSLYYYVSEEARRSYHEQGLDYTPLYISCLLGFMGATGEPVSDLSVPGPCDILLIGAEDLTPDQVRELTSGRIGTVISFGAGPGHPCAVREKKIFDLLSLNEFEIPLFAPVLEDGLLEEGDASVLLRAGEKPAVLKKGRVYDFRFDLPASVWFSGDGFGDGGPTAWFPLGRTPDFRPLPPDMKMPYPYNDEMLFFVESILLDAGLPLLDRLPPMEDGTVADLALHISGDDDYTSSVFDRQAAAYLHSIGMRYHLNVMPGPGPSFILSQGDLSELESLGCECGLHTDFTVRDYSEESQRETLLHYLSFFGRPSLTGTNHCLIQRGSTAERLRWLSACGALADNGKSGEVDPSDINAFNLKGFSYGTSFPRKTLDDAAHGNAPIYCLEIPINYYEPRVGGPYPGPEGVLNYIDDAAREGRIAQFFCHPHYLEDHGAHTPWARAAIEAGLSRARDKGYRIFRTTTDEIALFWHARSLSKISSKDGALTVSSATSVVLRLPDAQAPGTVLLDGKPVRPLHAKRPGRFIPVPGGTHTIELQ